MAPPKFSHRSFASFLMHRVELKALVVVVEELHYRVPNVPCGVERLFITPSPSPTHRVPNVPCGVERHRGVIHFSVVVGS